MGVVPFLHDNFRSDPEAPMGEKDHLIILVISPQVELGPHGPSKFNFLSLQNTLTHPMAVTLQKLVNFEEYEISETVFLFTKTSLWNSYKHQLFAFLYK